LVARICAGDSDWYVVAAPAEVTLEITFDGAEADLDIESFDLQNELMEVSDSTEDHEAIEIREAQLVRVHGYNNSTGTYRLTVE